MDDRSIEELIAGLEERFGVTSEQARDWYWLLFEDGTVLSEFWKWLDTGQVDRDFGGDFPMWICSECVPHPTMGELLDQGRLPLESFLYLGKLAREVHDEIEGMAEEGYWTLPKLPLEYRPEDAWRMEQLEG